MVCLNLHIPLQPLRPRLILVSVREERARLRPRGSDSLLPQREAKRRLLQRREPVHLLHPLPRVSGDHEPAANPKVFERGGRELGLVVRGVYGCPLAVTLDCVRGERSGLDDGDLNSEAIVSVEDHVESGGDASLTLMFQAGSISEASVSLNPSRAGRNNGNHLSPRSATSKREELTELGRRVVRRARHALEPAGRRDLEQASARALGVHLAEEPDSLARDPRSAPEVRLEHRARVRVGHGLDLPERDERSVVRDDVDAPELRLRGGERVEDVLLLGDVELEREQAVGGVLCDEVCEDLRAAGGRNCGVAVLEDDLG